MSIFLKNNKKYIVKWVYNLRKLFDTDIYREYVYRFKNSVLWKRIFKNFSIGLTGSVINIILSLIKTAVLTKSLTVNNYGIIMIAINFYSFGNIILDIKISDLIYRFLPYLNKRGEINAVAGIINLGLLISFFISITTIFVILIFSDWFASTLYEEKQISKLLKIYLLAGAFTVFHGFSTSILRLKDEFYKIIIPQVLGTLLTVICLIIYILVLGEDNLANIVGIIALGTMIGFIIPLYYALKMTRLERAQISFMAAIYSLKKYNAELKSMILQTNIASYLKLGSETGGIFLLGIFGTPVQVALYNVANQLTAPLNILLQNVTPALYPEIVNLYAEEKYRTLKAMINKITIITVLIGGVLIVCAYFLVEPVIVLFTTDNYLGAIPVFLVLLSIIYLSFISLSFYPLAVAMDELRWRNLIVSLKLFFIGIVYFIGFNAMNIALAQLLGNLFIRFFNDIPLYEKLKNKLVSTHISKTDTIK